MEVVFQLLKSKLHKGTITNNLAVYPGILKLSDCGFLSNVHSNNILRSAVSDEDGRLFWVLPELFLCFATFVFLGSIVLTSLFSLF